MYSLSIPLVKPNRIGLIQDTRQGSEASRKFPRLAQFLHPSAAPSFASYGILSGLLHRERVFRIRIFSSKASGHFM